MDYLFASHHKGPRFKSPGGYLCETGILLLALSRYSLLFSERKDWVEGGNLQAIAADIFLKEQLRTTETKAWGSYNN
jgi:hypothetical protein